MTLYSCTHCDYQNQHPCNVKTHITRHHKIKNPKIHECKFCGKMYANLFQMKAHMGKTYCTNTNKEFARNLQAKLSQRRYYDCSKCNYRSWVPGNVIRHMIDRHNIAEPKIFRCDYCHHMYANATDLNVHVKKCQNKKSNVISTKKILSNGEGSDSEEMTDESEVIATPQKKPKNVKVTEAKKSGAVNRKVSSAGQQNKKVEIRWFKCLLCSYQSKYPSHIRSHMKNVHRVANPMINECEFCGGMFRNSYILKKHMSTCGKPGNVDEQVTPPATATELYFDCPVCSFRSGDKHSLQQHMNSEHNTSPHEVYRCNICQEMFQYGTELKAHIMKCQKHNKNENDNQQRKKRSSSSALGESSASRIKVESFANRNKISKQNLQTSEIKEEMTSPKMKNSSNLKTSNMYRKVNKQINFVKQARKNMESEVKFVNCLKCSYKSKYPSHIRSHMKKVHGVANPKINKCQYCGEFFQNSFVQKRHEETCKKTVQEMSNRVTKTRLIKRKVNNLNRRVNKVPVKLYHCKQCKKVCTTFLELRIHKKEAHYTRPSTELDIYKCLKCDYESMYTCSVRAHMKMTHNVTNPKIHRCKFCGEMFQNLYQLKGHMKETYCVNTNKDFAKKLSEAQKKRWKYYCSICSYIAGYPQCIRSHLRVKHHINDPRFFKCEPCREIFVDASQLKKHKCGKKQSIATTTKLARISEENGRKRIIKSRKASFSPQQTQDSDDQAIYVCDACELAFDTSMDFEKHKKLSKCSKLGVTYREKKVFGNSLLMTKASINRAAKDPLESFDCSDTPSSSNDLNDSNRFRNKKSPLKEKIIPYSNSCSLCNESFHSKGEFDAHLLLMHSESPTKSNFDLNDEENLQIMESDDANEDLTVTTEMPEYDEDFEIIETKEEDITEHNENLEECQDNHILPLSDSDMKSTDSTSVEDLLFLQLGDPAASTEEVPQVLQWVSDQENPQQENGEQLDLSSFPPDTVFYTYEGDEIDLDAQGNEETVYYTYEYLDDANLGENVIVPDESANWQLNENEAPDSTSEVPVEEVIVAENLVVENEFVIKEEANQCTLCGIICVNKSALVNHMKKHEK